MLKIKSKINLWFRDLKKKIDSNARFYLDKHHWTPSSIHYTKRLWIACIQFMSSYFCHHSRTFEWKRNEKLFKMIMKGPYIPSYSSFGFFFYQILISICILMKNKSNIPRRKEGVYIYELSFQRDVWPSCIFWEWKCKHCSNWLISAQNCRLKREKSNKYEVVHVVCMQIMHLRTEQCFYESLKTAVELHSCRHILKI